MSTNDKLKKIILGHKGDLAPQIGLVYSLRVVKTLCVLTIISHPDRYLDRERLSHYHKGTY